MELKRPLKINVFFNTEASFIKKRQQLEPEYQDFKRREMIFYHINAIAPHQFLGKDYGMIYANGDEFITTIPFALLEKRIGAIILCKSS